MRNLILLILVIIGPGAGLAQSKTDVLNNLSLARKSVEGRFVIQSFILDEIQILGDPRQTCWKTMRYCLADKRKSEGFDFLWVQGADQISLSDALFENGWDTPHHKVEIIPLEMSEMVRRYYVVIYNDNSGKSDESQKKIVGEYLFNVELKSDLKESRAKVFKREPTFDWVPIALVGNQVRP